MRNIRVRTETFFIPLRMALTLGKGGVLSSSAFLILAKSYWFLFHIAIKHRIPVCIPIYFQGMKFRILLESSVDLALIREVFLDEEYAHPRIRDAKIIFDVGANVGVASMYFHALYPEARIYAFEPDPILFKKLEERMKGLDNLIPMQVALTDTDGTITFYSSPSRPLSGSIVRRAEEDQAQDVSSRTLHSIAAELGITSVDLLKFDIEGSEGKLFASELDRAIPMRLTGEVHLDLLGMSKEEFTGLFPDFNGTFTRQTAASRYLFSAEKRGL